MGYVDTSKMGYVDTLKSLFGGDAKTKRITEKEYGLLTDDKTKLKSSNKQEKKDSIETEPNEVIKDIKQLLNDGVLKHPKVPNSDNVVPADFYRRGRIGEIKRGDPELTVKYDVLPRTIDEIPEDKPASIRLIGRLTKGSKGEDHDLIPPYTKILLTNVQEAHNERSQIVETFGRFYVFFYGERPPIYTFTGSLINANNVNWAQDFQFYYSNYLRGTKCVEFNARVVITYGYDQIEGFIMGMGSSKNANDPNKVDVSFQVLVIDRKVLKLSADFGLLEADGTFSPDKNLITMITKGSSEPYPSKANKDARDMSAKKINPSSNKKPKSKDLKDIEGQFGDEVKKEGLKLTTTKNGAISTVQRYRGY